MKKKPAKYIVTCGPFDDQTNNLKQARKNLKNHVIKMKELYNDNGVYSIYMVVESRKFGDE